MPYKSRNMVRSVRGIVGRTLDLQILESLKSLLIVTAKSFWPLTSILYS